MPNEKDPFASEFAPSCVIGVRVETGEMQTMPDGRPVAVVCSHTTNPLQPGASSEEIALTRTECLELARRLTTAARAMLKFERKLKASPTMLSALRSIERGKWRCVENRTLDALVSRGLIEPDDGGDPRLARFAQQAETINRIFGAAVAAVLRSDRTVLVGEKRDALGVVAELSTEHAAKSASR